MYYRCYICHRPPGGFCWLDPVLHPSIHRSTRSPMWNVNACRETEKYREKHAQDRRHTFKRFCSKTCQDIYYHLYHKGVRVNLNQLEQKAAAAVIGPLADYVMSVGIHKSVGEYSKEDIIGLVDVVLESYHNALQTLYKDEVPF